MDNESITIHIGHDVTITPVEENQPTETPKPKMTPSVGRIVHYQAFGTPGGEYASVPRAAIITQVNNDGTVGLAVINPTGLFFNPSVHYDSDNAPGTWHQPPFVPQR